jgi:hypothetical protein
MRLANKRKIKLKILDNNSQLKEWYENYDLLFLFLLILYYNFIIFVIYNELNSFKNNNKK